MIHIAKEDDPMADASSDSAPETILLNCLEGRPAPPTVTEGWRQFGTIPEAAWPHFWLLLAPMLLTPESRSNQELISLFCEEHDVAPQAALAAVGGCELLLRQAAALDLDAAAFEQDLRQLSGGADERTRFVAPRYPEAKKELRKQIFMESLAAHGKVMTGLEWRLDRVQHSSRGNRLDSDIVLLTLNYREGHRQDHVTLQLTREAALSLKAFCDRLPPQRNRG
jgi:hypothetical protein